MLNLHKKKIARNNSPRFRRFRLATVGLSVICAALLCMSIWPLKLIQIGHAGQQKNVKQEFDAKQVNDKIRRGLGRQVRFASPTDSPEKVSESVWQVDKFIYERSGLKMSKQTRERLIAMESRALKGEGHRIRIEELTDALTETAVERISTLTDREIEDTGKTLLDARGFIRTRASGGIYLTPDEFSAQTRAGRDKAQVKDKLLRDGVRNFIAAGVKDRAVILGEALPEHFGRASEVGLTPLQAVVLTYSIASDDMLNGSQSELQETVNQINQTKGNREAKSHIPERAYGVNGRIFSTPLNLVFNPKTIGSFLDRIEKGGAK